MTELTPMFVISIAKDQDIGFAILSRGLGIGLGGIIALFSAPALARFLEGLFAQSAIRAECREIVRHLESNISAVERIILALEDDNIFHNTSSLSRLHFERFCILDQILELSPEAYSKKIPEDPLTAWFHVKITLRNIQMDCLEISNFAEHECGELLKYLKYLRKRFIVTCAQIESDFPVYSRFRFGNGYVWRRNKTMHHVSKAMKDQSKEPYFISCPICAQYSRVHRKPLRN